MARIASVAHLCIPDGEEDPLSRETPELPFDMGGYAQMRAAGPVVLAHWHNFEISRDNKLYTDSTEIYRRALTPGQLPIGSNPPNDGSSLFRTRPVPRPVIAGTDYQVADFVTDMRRADYAGVDCMFFNVGIGDYNRTEFIKKAWLAAEQLNAGRPAAEKFLVAWNIDMVSLPTWAASHPDPARRGQLVTPAEVADIVVDATRYGYASQWKYTKDAVTRAVLGGFSPGTDAASMQWVRDVIATCDARSRPVWFCPTFLSDAQRTAYLADTTISPRMVFYGMWGAVDGTSVSAHATHVTTARNAGKGYMYPVKPDQMRPKAEIWWEANGPDGWMALAEGAYTSRAEFVQLVTWNDFGEDTQVSPNTAQQWGVIDGLAWYIYRLKFRREPTIRRDMVHFYHRRVRTDVVPTSGTVYAKQNTATSLNRVTAVFWLTDPATCKIIQGSSVVTEDLPAGRTLLRANIVAGAAPRFQVIRGGTTVIDRTSHTTIAATTRFFDSGVRAGTTGRSDTYATIQAPIYD